MLIINKMTYSTIIVKKKQLKCGCYDYNFSKSRCKKHATLEDTANRIIKYRHENIKEDKYEIKTDETDELQTQTGELQTRNTLLEKNINGIFVNSDLVNEDKKCVDISSKKRGAFQYLELSNLQKCNDIFTYEPINKQLFVKTNESTKCITSLNDNDIIFPDKRVLPRVSLSHINPNILPKLK